MERPAPTSGVSIVASDTTRHPAWHTGWLGDVLFQCKRKQESSVCCLTGSTMGVVFMCRTPRDAIFRQSSGHRGGGDSHWPRPARRGGGGMCARSRQRGPGGFWCSCRTAAGASRGGARKYAACPIRVSSVGRRDTVAAELRSGRGKRVVDGVRGARGAVGGVPAVFGARVVPPAGASRGGRGATTDLGIFCWSSGPGDGGASLWPRPARR